MSGTAREAERAQELRRKAAEGDVAAKIELHQGEALPDAGKAQAHDMGQAKSPDTAGSKSLRTSPD